MTGPPDRTVSAAAEAAVRAVAREGEPDRYAAALLAPSPLQADLLTLAAFAAEIARVPIQVREPMMGEIRLQWWHDAVDAGAKGAASGHPVADALGDAIRRHALDRAPLHSAIEARLFDIGRGLHADEATLAAYFGATEGSIFALGLAVAGVAATPQSDPIAKAAGRAYGTARALSRLPVLLDKGGFPLPENRLTEFGVTAEAFAERPPTRETLRAVQAVAAALRTSALRDLGEVRQDWRSLGDKALPVLLPLALTEPYFAAQHSNRDHMLARITELSPLGRLWRLWRAHRRRTV